MSIELANRAVVEATQLLSSVTKLRNALEQPTPVPPPEPEPLPDVSSFEDPYLGFPRIGLGVDPVTRRTQFIRTETNTKRVFDQEGFNDIIHKIKSGPTGIDRIQLDLGAKISIDSNQLSGIKRPAHNPLVIEGGRDIPEVNFRASLDSGGVFSSSIAFVRIKFAFPVVWMGQNQNILFEECVGRFDVQGSRSAMHNAPTASNVQFRFCDIKDAYDDVVAHHVRGMHAYNVVDLLVQHCNFHRNGWKPGTTRDTPAALGGPTVNNHNAVFSAPYANLVFDQNLSSEASSHGVLAQGGTFTKNVFINCPTALQPSCRGDGSSQKAGVYRAKVMGNVALGSEDVNRKEEVNRGVFMQLEALHDSAIIGNHAVTNLTSPANDAVFFVNAQVPSGNGVMIEDNIARDWAGGYVVQGDSGQVAGYVLKNNQLEATASDGLNVETRRLCGTVNDPAFQEELKGNYFAGVDPVWLNRILELVYAG